MIRPAAYLLGFGALYFRIRWRILVRKHPPFHEQHDKRKCVFIHVPKAAGMSVQKAIFDQEELHGHPPAAAFLIADKARFDNYLTFSIMRDPVARFCSAFWFLKGGGLTAQDAAWASHHLSGIESPAALIQAMRNPWRRAQVLSWKHFTPQHWFFCHSNGALAVDILGRTEALDQTLARVSEALGQSYQPVRVNQSDRSDNDDLSDEYATIVRSWYRHDMQIYEALV